MTLAQIKSMNVHGNYHYDRPIFQAVDQFMLEEHPIPEKREALDYLNNVVMGLYLEPSNLMDVADYIAQILEG